MELFFVLLMVVTTLGLLFSGYPVGLTLGGISLLFGGLGIALGIVNFPLLNSFPLRILGILENQTLIAIPLFIVMGMVLEKSKLAEDLLITASQIMSNVKGGMAYAVIGVGTILAASTGIIGATVVTMTLIAMPVMLRQGYDPKIASGTIAASGSLGQIIPPSIMLILLADVISNANQVALTAGLQSFEVVSVGTLFSAAVVPGFALVAGYAILVFIHGKISPKSIPDVGVFEFVSPLSLKRVVFSFGAPLLLIISVLGAIMLGIAPPSEAAAIGAIGAIFLAAIKLALELNRTKLSALLLFSVLSVLLAGIVATSGMLSHSTTSIRIVFFVFFIVGICSALLVLYQHGNFGESLENSANLTGMIFIILVGASMFSLVFRAYGGDHYVESLFMNLPGGWIGALTLTLLLLFILGCFLDFLEIIFVVVPIVAPPLIILGVDPVWFAILVALVLQTSFLTPPFGFSLFYLKGVAPKSVTTAEVWRGALPFVGIQVTIVVLVLTIPQLATWLPNLLHG